MSATGMPSSQHAAALRIIGAATSRPRSRAWTGPTVTASSPVPNHALEITPVRTQRFSWMSCRRARSGVAGLGVRLEGAPQCPFETLREVGSQLAQLERLTPEPRDHHLLRVAAVERELSREHLERQDPERVDVGARVELLAADLF